MACRKSSVLPSIKAVCAMANARRSHDELKTASSRTIGPKPCIAPMSWIPSMFRSYACPVADAW